MIFLRRPFGAAFIAFFGEGMIFVLLLFIFI